MESCKEAPPGMPKSGCVGRSAGIHADGGGGKVAVSATAASLAQPAAVKV